MIIETWVAVMFVLMFVVFSFVALAGWNIADKRVENLMKENKDLLKENTQLKGKLAFIRMRVEMEKKDV